MVKGKDRELGLVTYKREVLAIVPIGFNKELRIQNLSGSEGGSCLEIREYWGTGKNKIPTQHGSRALFIPPDATCDFIDALVQAKDDVVK